MSFVSICKISWRRAILQIVVFNSIFMFSPCRAWLGTFQDIQLLRNAQCNPMYGDRNFFMPQHIEKRECSKLRLHNGNIQLAENEETMTKSQRHAVRRLIEKFQEVDEKDMQLLKRALDDSSKNGNLDFALGVAYKVTAMKLDISCVTATILFYILIGNGDLSTFSLDEKTYGSRIMDMLEGLCNLHAGIDQVSTFNYPPGKQNGKKYDVGKFFLAMASYDIRIVLIVLAHFAFSIQQASHLDKELAKDILQVYAPLAHRLGIYWLKTEMEDDAFAILYPKLHAKLEDVTQNILYIENENNYTECVLSILRLRMKMAGLENVCVTGRVKQFYSIFKKMRKLNQSFSTRDTTSKEMTEKVNDLVAFRVIVEDVKDCYTCLGIVHGMWKPVSPVRIKDYISSPKPNGYQSLHTTVTGLENKQIEIQIRTREMHEMAENGDAAHWVYKKDQYSPVDNNSKTTLMEAENTIWMRQLVEWVQQMEPARPEMYENDIDDMYDMFSASEGITKPPLREIYVFSPKGDLYELTVGSSVLDFAYAVHTQVGHQCAGAKVNGQMVSLKHLVQNGDTIQIITLPNQTPKREWLKHVNTLRALRKIKGWLNSQQRQENIALGQSMYEKAFKKYIRDHHNSNLSSTGRSTSYKHVLEETLKEYSFLNDEESLFLAISSGQITPISIFKNIFEIDDLPSSSDNGGLSKTDQRIIEVSSSFDYHTNSMKVPSKQGSGAVVVGNERNIMVSFCGHCNPLHGEEIKGIVSRGNGIKVHRLDCPYLLQSEDYKKIDAAWDDSKKAEPRLVQLVVVFHDAPGMLAKMSKRISSNNVNIKQVMLNTLSNERGLVKFDVMLTTHEEKESLVRNLQNEPGIISVERK